MNREITLTPEGGRFYRAMAFHWVTVALCLPPLMALHDCSNIESILV